MTFFLGDPPENVQVAARGTDTPLTSFWGGVSAGFQKEQLESNANFRAGRETIRTDDELAVEAARHMGSDRIGQMVDDFNARARAAGMRERQMPEDMADLPSIFGPNFSKALLDEARNDPEWDGPEITPEASEKRTNERLKKEHRDLSETLNTMGGGRTVAEIAGAIGGAMADIRNLPLLIAGGGTGSFARIMGREAMLNVAAEGVTMPDRFAMAERLDIPKPDVAMTLAYAAAGGALLGGAVEGLARGITYWRGTRAGKPSETVASYDQQLNADIAEDAIVDLSRPFERVQSEVVEGQRAINMRLEDFADQQPLSGLRIGPAGERVPVGFDEWVSPPTAGADVRLPRSSTALPIRPDSPDMSRFLEQVEAHQIDNFARGVDPEAFAQRDALLAAARRQRAQSQEAVPQYELDRQAARDGAVQEIDRLERELKSVRGKKERAAIRAQIQEARADLVEIESLRGQTDGVAAQSRAAVVEAEQAVMSSMSELAPRISAARAQAVEQIGSSPRSAPADQPLGRADYDTAVAEYEEFRRRGAEAGRQLDAELFEMPPAPGWVDVPKEREAVAAYRTDDLRTQIEKDGDFSVGGRSVNSLLDELDADDEFADIIALCGRRNVA